MYSRQVSQKVVVSRKGEPTSQTKKEAASGRQNPADLMCNHNFEILTRLLNKCLLSDNTNMTMMTIMTFKLEESHEYAQVDCCRGESKVQ